jgi:hypothetical protein
MQYSGIVSILPRQLRIHEKHLEPIGIFDGSRCWGVWVKNRHPPSGSESAPASSTEMPYHFAISPFHPSSWQFLVRIVLKVSHRKGALAECAKCLRDQDVNILFARCSQTGFSHATWNVIGELLKEKTVLTQDRERLEKEAGSSEDMSKKTAEAKNLRTNHYSEKLAVAMFTAEATLTKNILAAQPTGLPFLHTRCVDNQVHMFDRNSVLNGISKRTLGKAIKSDAITSCKEYGDPAVRVEWLFHIPYISVWGSGMPGAGAIEFLYDRAKNCLNVQGAPALYYPMPLGSLGHPVWSECAQRAIGTFDTNELFARLIPLPSPDWKQMLCDINLGYEIVNRDPDASAPGIDSKGLLYDCADLIARDMDLLHVSNKITDSGPQDEIGEINFLGQFMRDARDRNQARGELKSLLKGYESKRRQWTESQSGISFRLTKLEVVPHSLEKIFVSIRFAHPREHEIESLLNEAAREQGVLIEIVKTYSERATDKIFETMRLCSGFLQLLLFKKEDDPEKVEFAWLNFEYGMAIGLNLPRLRMVDTVQRGYDWWQGRVETDRDLYLKGFRTDVSEKQLLREFNESIGDIASKFAEG